MDTITQRNIIDRILLAVLLFSAFRAYKVGFFSSVISLAGSFGSLIVSWFISSTYSQTIFDSVMRQSLITRSYNYLLQASESIDVETAINSVIGKWPQEFVNNILIKAEESLKTLLVPTEESAIYLVDNFIAPIIVACISVVIFIVCFTLIKVLTNFLAKLFKSINKVPIIGAANKFAGFAVGIITGGISIILLSFLLSIIVIITGDKMSWLNSYIISQSKLLALTGVINPFLP